MNIIFNEDTNFTSSGLQRGPRNLLGSRLDPIPNKNSY